jgi:hypothetical protein
MATEVQIGSRRFYIVSEPDERQGWTAKVLEVSQPGAVPKALGIVTSGATRSEADERAYGVLQHKIREAEKPSYNQ